MGLKGMLYAGTLAAAGAIGAIGGHYCTLDREYRIERICDGVSLTALSLEKSYSLTQTGKEFYLGDSDHNIKGVKAMATVEGRRSEQPTVRQLEGKVSELEGKIWQRQLVDDAESIGDAVKYGWNNLKRSLIR